MLFEPEGGQRDWEFTPSENIDGGAQSPPAGFTFAAYVLWDPDYSEGFTPNGEVYLLEGYTGPFGTSNSYVRLVMDANFGLKYTVSIAGSGSIVYPEAGAGGVNASGAAWPPLTQVQAGVWTHVAVVHTPDGGTATYGGVGYPTGTVEFYVDGVRYAPPSAWTPPRLPNIDASVSSNLYNLGQSKWGYGRSISGACGNCSFVGSMRDVYLWNAALTPTEVDALRLSNTLPATTPDPPSRTPILATGITNQYICEQTPPSPPPLPSPPPPSAPPLSPPSASPSPPPTPPPTPTQPVTSALAPCGQRGEV